MDDKDILSILDSRIANMRKRREMSLEMASLYHGLKDSHGIADAGMELQALDRVVSTLMDIKEELLK